MQNKRKYNSIQKYLLQENRKFHQSSMQYERVDIENNVNIPPKVAIVIVSYNHKQMMIECIESIRKNNASDTYKLIVVDNASDDGVVEWLEKQNDILLIANKENKGFPYACNQGIAAADKDMDIFLLNNDTIVPNDALFWLRMGLYENEEIGAVGSVSNNVVNYQQVKEQYSTVREWMDFAVRNNVEMEYPYENKSWLVGFAMLIKRKAIDKLVDNEKITNEKIPEILDTRFSPGNYEDNDLSIRLIKNGYRLLLCKNSFIYHYGGSSFKKFPEKYTKLLLENEKKLELKYGIDYVPFSYVESTLVDMIKENRESFSVLEFGCKLGATLARIQSIFPKADIYGLEENPKLYELARQVVPVTLSMNDINGKWDYIILDRLLSKDNALELLEKAIRHLKTDGGILISVDNMQCIRENRKGMCLDEILSVCNEIRLKVQDFNYKPIMMCSDDEKRQLDEKIALNGIESRPLYEAQRYIFMVKMC